MKASEIKIVFSENEQGKLMIECKVRECKDKDLDAIAHAISLDLAPYVNSKIVQLFNPSKTKH